MKVSGHLHALTALPPGKKTGTYWIGGWVNPSVGLDAVEKRKILPLLGIEPGPSIPSLSRLLVMHTVSMQWLSTYMKCKVRVRLFEQLMWVLKIFCCLNEIIPRFEKVRNV
jgi:hypothetical protein